MNRTPQESASDRRTSPEDERQLLARVAGGDRAAFAALYRRYRRPLSAYLARLTGRVEGVEELVDDTLLVVWDRAGDFRGRSRPSSWIFGIAHRKGLKSLERRSRRGEGASLADVAEPSHRRTPERAWDRRELAELVGEALARLPAEQRSVVVLTYHHGLSYPEIAEVVGCPVGTVKSRMFHARRKLAGLLPELGVGADPGEGR